MEINYCLACNEVLNSDSSDFVNEHDMEVSLFEDLNKQKTINKLLENEESVILCKSCRFLLEITIDKQIADNEETLVALDSSIDKARGMLSEIEKNYFLIEDNLEAEILAVDKKIHTVTSKIDHYTQEVMKTENKIQECNERQIEEIHYMMKRADNFFELETRSKVIQEELEYLNSKPILLKVFHIKVTEKIGKINELRLGRLDHMPTTWDEINAAWGQTAFLVFTIMSVKNFKSQKINLYPLGTNSRISYKKDDDKRFELYFSDCNYTNLIQGFNRAQEIFLELVEEVQIMLGDKGAPYNIERGQIGGLVIKFEPNYKDRWTQALKFLLQDLNYFLYKIL